MQFAQRNPLERDTDDAGYRYLVDKRLGACARARLHTCLRVCLCIYIYIGTNLSLLNDTCFLQQVRLDCPSCFVLFVTLPHPPPNLPTKMRTRSPHDLVL